MISRTKIEQIRRLSRKHDATHELHFALASNVNDLTMLAIKGLYADELAGVLLRVSNLYVLRTTLSGTALRLTADAKKLLARYKMAVVDV